MTKTPFSEETLARGASIGALIQDSERRGQFAERLAGQGDATVLADGIDTVHLIIPANVDTASITDEEYLEELGRRALGACVYHIQPD